jgi:hypothetical protein
VTLVITGVSEERIASIIKVTRIGELGTMLGVTSIRNVGDVEGVFRPQLRSDAKLFQLSASLYPPRSLSQTAPRLPPDTDNDECDSCCVLFAIARSLEAVRTGSAVRNNQQARQAGYRRLPLSALHTSRCFIPQEHYCSVCGTHFC